MGDDGDDSYEAGERRRRRLSRFTRQGDDDDDVDDRRGKDKPFELRGPLRTVFRIVVSWGLFKVTAHVVKKTVQKVLNEEGWIPDEIREALHVVGKSMQKITKGLGAWGLAELTFGLYAVFRLHTTAMHEVEKALEDHDSLPPEQENQLYATSANLQAKDLLLGLEAADAAYFGVEAEDPEAYLLEYLRQRDVMKCGSVIKYQAESRPLKPAYYIVVDHTHEWILVGMRGTMGVADVLTDLAGSSEKYGDGHHVHCGMMESAQWLMIEEEQRLIDLMKEYPDYKLKLVGHSMGAGTAIFTALILLDGHAAKEAGISKDRVMVQAYAPPACASLDLAQSLDYVTAVILQDDIVPRASIGALEDLRNEVLTCDWSEAVFGDEEETKFSTGKKLLKVVQQKLCTPVEEDQPNLGKQDTIKKTKSQPSIFDERDEVDAYAGARPDPKNGEEPVGVAKTEEEVPMMPRLYPPGRLLHVIRRAKTEDEKSADNTDKGSHEDEAKKKDGGDLKRDEVGYEILQGWKPADFAKIVVSASMVVDHYTTELRQALQYYASHSGDSFTDPRVEQSAC
eukprot:jgi/Chlat1/7747/Chrsp66S09166